MIVTLKKEKKQQEQQQCHEENERRALATKLRYTTLPRHHLRFIKDIYQHCWCFRHGRGFWKDLNERLDITPERVAIIDTHFDQPGSVLFEATLKGGRAVSMNWRDKCWYPHVDLEGQGEEVGEAVDRLLRAERKAVRS